MIKAQFHPSPTSILKGSPVRYSLSKPCAVAVMVSVNNPPNSARANDNDKANGPGETPQRNTTAEEVSFAAAPAGCALRGRAEDSALAAASFATHLRSMDNDVLNSLIRARESAAGLAKAFPDGDKRFADSSDEEEEEIEEENGSDDGGDEPCVGLFDETRTDNNPKLCLLRVRDEHNFDLLATMAEFSLDFLARIRTVNFIRHKVRDAVPTSQVIESAKEAMADKSSGIWKDDTLLKPVVEGDILLTALEDDIEDDDEDDVQDDAHREKNITTAIAENIHNALK